MLKSFPFHPSPPQLKPMNNTSSFRYIPFWSCPWIVMRLWSCHLDVIIQPFDLHWLTPSCFRWMPSISSVRTAPIYLKAQIREESIRLREKKDAGEKSNHKHLHVLHSTVSLCSVCVCWGFSRLQKWCTKKSKFLSEAVDCSWHQRRLQCWVMWMDKKQCWRAGLELVLGLRCAEGSVAWDGT